MERMTSGTDDRDVGQKLLDAVNRLEEHIETSMADLKENEIKAAWDLVRWLQGIEIKNILTKIKEPKKKPDC